MANRKVRSQAVVETGRGSEAVSDLHMQPQEGASDRRTRITGKKASTECQEPGPNIKRGCKVVDSEHKVTDSVDKTATADVSRGIRRAKADALDNAVWKSLAPSSSRKRSGSATGMLPPKTVRKKWKAVPKNDVPEEQEPEVSIPIPPAPKKARNSIRQASSTRQSTVSRHKVNDDPSNSKLSSVTESESSLSDIEIDESETEDDDEGIVADTNIVSNNGPCNMTATERRFMNEQAFWVDKENIPPPSTSATIATPKFVIRGDPIVVSNDDTADNSPTVRHGLAVIKKEPLQDTIGPAVNSQEYMAMLNSALVGSSPLGWPLYTNIIMSPESKDIKLSIQPYELKLVIRKAISLIEGRLRFDHAFPSLSVHSEWNQAVLEEACTIWESTSYGNIKLKYARIKERIRVDNRYVSDISTLLHPRVCGHRTDTKATAIINTRAGYGLHCGSTQLVQTLLQQKRYIYPPAPQGNGVLRNRPFEHSAIIGTLHDDLFSGSHTIVTAYPDRYEPGKEDTFALVPSMVALAATAVFTAIKEWESGARIPLPFTSNVYTDIYHGHINDMEEIKRRNELAYNALMRRLFQMALGFGNDQLNDNDIDIENMAVV